MHSEKNLARRIENYWNERSKDFSRVRRLELSGEDGDAWKNLLEKNFPQGESLKILDVGTGAGFFAVLLTKLGHFVTGIDTSSAMINEARKNSDYFHCQPNFLKMDAQSLDFPSENFDVVISRNLTWTLPDAMQAYREWCRVLKIGGMLMNFDSDYGDKNFVNEKVCAKGEVADKMLVECNEIKNSLRISTHRRPDWDVELLTALGCRVRHEEDISQLVHKNKNIPYDSVPLFAIFAEKIQTPK